MTNERKRAIARKIYQVLQEDILFRYDNNEYWDFELDAIADILIGLNEADKKAVLSLIR